MAENDRRTEAGRLRESRLDVPRSFSQRNYGIILTLLVVFAVLIVVYFLLVAKSFGEAFWALSIFLFIVTLGLGGVANWLEVRISAGGRALRMAARPFFHVNSSLVVAATAYRFGGPEAAWLAGTVWFMLLIFLSVRNARRNA